MSKQRQSNEIVRAGPSLRLWGNMDLRPSFKEMPVNVKTAICQLRGQHGGGSPSVLRRNQPADAVSLVFQPPDLGDGTFLLFKPPGPWYFVMAGPGNQPG